MRVQWDSIFSLTNFDKATMLSNNVKIHTLAGLKDFLDFVHIKYALLKPYYEEENYPCVEPQELIPSFEVDSFEYKNLPGFSLVAFERRIIPYDEIFQFDYFYPTQGALRTDIAQKYLRTNIQTLQNHIPRVALDSYKKEYTDIDISLLENYTKLFPYLLMLDRAHVFGLQGGSYNRRSFSLSGVFASFPSDLDAEVKRYGLRIGKFKHDAPEMYDENRNFVLQHLMELYGYPISSERKTSAALFARKLHRLGESFLIRTLGQSDRVITTIWSDGSNTPYPMVEKLAILHLEDTDKESLRILKSEGFFLDKAEKTLLVRIRYKQHKFNAENVRQERAISVASQEIIHPISARVLKNVNVLRESSNMFLLLNDIVRGEYTGKIVYKKNEIIENTSTEENRLKFLSAWLTKHQRRIIAYSDEFYQNIERVLKHYLIESPSEQSLKELKELRAEVMEKYRYIQQARQIHVLEKLAHKSLRGEKIGYKTMLVETVRILHSLKFEIVSYFDSLVSMAIYIGESILDDRYLVRNYIDKSDDQLTPSGLEIKKQYGRLVAAIDELKAIQKTRASILY